MEKKKSGYTGNMDRRIIIQKLLRRDIVEDDLKDYLKGLPDLSGQMESISIDIYER